MRANPFLIDMLGYSYENFVGKAIWELGFLKDIVANKDNFEELKKKEYVRYEDMPLETADGRRKEVEFISNVYLVDGKKTIQCNIRDITERRKIEYGLEKTRIELEAIKVSEDEAREYAESIINTVREPLLALDQDLRVVTASRSFYDIFKVNPKDTVGHLIYDLGNKQWDIPKLRELLETILPQKATFDNYEVEHDFASIGRRIMILNGRQIQRVSGKERIILLSIEDITERKRVEEALQVSETTYRRLFESAKDGILILDVESGMAVDANPFLTELLGYSHEKFLGKAIWDLGIFKDIVANKDNFEELKSKEYIRYEDMPLETADGRRIEVEFVSNVYLVNNHKVIQCNIRDITEHKQAEHREQLAREVLEILNRQQVGVSTIREILLLIKKFTDMEAVAIHLKKGDDFPYYETNGFHDDFILAERNLCARDKDGNIIRDELGKPELDCMCGNILCNRTNPVLPFFTEGGSFWSNCTTELIASTTEADRQARTRNRCNGEGYESVSLIPLRSDNEIIGLLQLNDRRANRFTLEMIHFFEGLGASIGIALSRKQREEEITRVAQEWQATFDAMDDVVWILDKDQRIVRSNRAVNQFFKRSCEEVLGKHCWEIAHDTTQPICECPIQRSQKSLRRETLDSQIGNKWFEITVDPILDGSGQYAGAVHTVSDITERKQAEVELEEKEWLLSESQRIAHIGTWELNIETSKIFWSEEMYNIYDISPDVFKHDTQDFFKLLHPEDIHSMEEWFSACYSEKKPSELVFRAILPNGNIRWISGQGEMHFDDEHKPVRFVGSAQDITERKQAEEALQFSKEQLRQSQKMEAVGRLAGGIAHDFNNMLTVINNYAEFVIAALKSGDPLRSDIEEILKAGQRSAVLTKQLLAFSRKQVLAPEVLDMNKIVAGIEPMIRRLIGEDIDLIFCPKEGLGKVKADPGQIEQVIMNLAVNSRDAMPRGGKITVETANRELDKEYKARHLEIVPGPYVMLSVTDTGCGMDEATINSIFEPFFTTKESGKGTGLGLSTVYGIVKQSGGDIFVYSEEGKGTTFKIYFPREFSEAETITRAKKTDKPTTGTETILVVEDEPGVLSLVKRVLEAAGYTIHTAANGGEALLVCESRGNTIQLLITDIVMPNMGGRELTERLAKVCPNIKTLYMSGYTEDAILRSGILDHGINFISKPFSLHVLTAKVREVLDQ